MCCSLICNFFIESEKLNKMSSLLERLHVKFSPNNRPWTETMKLVRQVMVRCCRFGARILDKIPQECYNYQIPSQAIQICLPRTTLYVFFIEPAFAQDPGLCSRVHFIPSCVLSHVYLESKPNEPNVSFHLQENIGSSRQVFLQRSKLSGIDNFIKEI